MRETFLGLDSNRRFAVLALAAGLLLLAFFLVQRAREPDFVPLFRQVDLAEMGGITDRLTKASITYRLIGDGSEVDVPTGDAARARVLLAKDGVPANGRPGLELFDRPSWGMTDFTQHITYRRALEGELARTIGTLRGVERAQVHLALPETSPLRRAEKPAEAAVVISLRAGTTLSPEQVQGITQLVSGSVDQLTPDHVAVLDDSGQPLTGPSADNGGSALTAHQLAVQRGVEQQLATKVEQLLAPALGPSAVKVQVAARLNFDQVERTIEAYDPAGKVLANEQRSQTGADSGTSTDAGTVINNTYLNSRKIEKIIGEVGNVTRLSVSVMVNTRALKPDASAQDEQKAAMAALVRNAIGIDTTRGDQLAVIAVPFTDPVPASVSAPADATAIPKPTMLELASRFALPVIALFAVLVALMLGFRALRPGVAAGALAAGGAGASFPGAAGGSALGDGSSARSRLQADAAAASPDAAARVIRAWLADAS